MCGRLWPLLLLSLTACAPKVSDGAATQTMRAGDLEITVSAPKWVTRQEFYPLKVTYTNTSSKAVELSDPFSCGHLQVQDAVTGKVLKPPRQTNYGCFTDLTMLTLAPGQSHSGAFSGIIEKYPTGSYRIAPEQLQLRFGKSRPAVQEIRFQIR